MSSEEHDPYCPRWGTLVAMLVVGVVAVTVGWLWDLAEWWREWRRGASRG